MYCGGFYNFMEETKERFLKHVDKKGDDDCWEWTGARFEKGYGAFKFMGKIARASRVAYTLYIGEIPNELHVLHQCDNPPCVNPNHLWLGTHIDNMRDMIKKGRQRIGVEKEIKYKLTEEQKKEKIRIYNQTPARRKYYKEYHKKYLAINREKINLGQKRRYWAKQKTPTQYGAFASSGKGIEPERKFMRLSRSQSFPPGTPERILSDPCAEWWSRTTGA